MVVEADLAIGMEAGVDMGIGTGMGMDMGMPTGTEKEKEENTKNVVIELLLSHEKSQKTHLQHLTKKYHGFQRSE